jgi:hypothetical protein
MVYPGVDGFEVEPSELMLGSAHLALEARCFRSANLATVLPCGLDIEFQLRESLDGCSAVAAACVWDDRDVPAEILYRVLAPVAGDQLATTGGI